MNFSSLLLHIHTQYTHIHTHTHSVHFLSLCFLFGDTSLLCCPDWSAQPWLTNGCINRLGLPHTTFEENEVVLCSAGTKQSHVAIGQLKWGWCDWRAEWFYCCEVLIALNINKCKWPVATWLMAAGHQCLVSSRLIAVISRVVYIIDFVNMLGITRSSR